MTWHSGADIIKDLAALDEFDAFKNEETCSALYSFGRGVRTSRKPNYSNEFIDPRTGETIDLDEGSTDVDDCYKTKGRGAVLGYSLRTKSQLQKQLRLARPLGSSDEMIESYFRRNIPTKSNENSSCTSDSESDLQKPSTLKQSSDSLFFSNRNISSAKARRNSKYQYNALINGLLSKNLNITKERRGEKGKDLCRDNCINNENFIDFETDDDIDTTLSCVSTTSHELSSKNSLESEIEKYESDKQVNSSWLHSQEKCKFNTVFKNPGDVPENMHTKRKMEKNSKFLDSSHGVCGELTDQQQIYKKLGEDHNRKRKYFKYHSNESCFKSKQLSNFPMPQETYSGDEDKDVGELSRHFSVNFNDFPPL